MISEASHDTCRDLEVARRTIEGDLAMTTRRIESFLLRLVIETHDDAESDAWRGRVQHVASGTERQFEHLQDLIACINAQFGDAQILLSRDDETASDI